MDTLGVCTVWLPFWGSEGAADLSAASVTFSVGFSAAESGAVGDDGVSFAGELSGGSADFTPSEGGATEAFGPDGSNDSWDFDVAVDWAACPGV